jgi:hypothetical protein
MKTFFTYVFVIFFSLSSHSTYSSSITDYFKNGEFSGHFNSAVSISGTPDNAIKEAGIDSSARSGGSALSLNYKNQMTENWYFGTRVQLGFDWGIHDKSTGSSVIGGENDSRITADGLSYQNYYIGYDFSNQGSKTLVKLGRQDVITPLVMRSGLFPLWDAFEGVVITNKDIDDTIIQFIVLDKWVKRYRDNGKSAGALRKDADFHSPVWSLHVKSKATKNWLLEGQLLVNDNEESIGDAPTLISTYGGYKSLYLSTNYQIPESNLILGSQFKSTDYKDSVTAKYFGIKAEVDLSSYILALSYTRNSDNANSPGTLGHVPWIGTYGNTITVNDIFAGVSSFGGKIQLDFESIGLSADLTHNFLYQSAKGQAVSDRNLDEAQQTTLTFRLKPKHSKSFSIRFQLAHTDYKSGSGDDDFWFSRLFVNYHF